MLFITALRVGKKIKHPLPTIRFDSKRHQTTFSVYNPSANIRNHRLRDPKITDFITPLSIRPRLPESIQPVEMRYPAEAPPWPYREKNYYRYHRLVDVTTKRFDENTKLIVVEGNIGSGKGKFAADLAKILDFHFIPAPSMDDLLINSYGMDMRSYYHLFPERYQIFDAEMFYKAPKHKNVNIYQYFMYALKFEACCNAFAHILNTGQGVVMERSPFTDIAFVEAMYNKDLLSDYFADWYPKLLRYTFDQLYFRPHLYVYVDVPVSQCLENIKKRGIPHENNGKVIDYEYLSDIEKHMKNFLKQAEKNSEVLLFDWKVPGDIDRAAEDIYKIDFSFDFYQNDRFLSWNGLAQEHEWNNFRAKYTQKNDAMNHFNWSWWEVPELVPVKDELTQMRYVLGNIVGNYAAGFNQSRGDSLWNVLFSKNHGSQYGNAKWTEYTLKNSLWAMAHQSFLYTEKPFLPNLTEEHFAPRKFDVEQLEHH